MRVLGWILVLLGCAAAAAGILLAVREIGFMYTDVMDDPLADSVEPKERAGDILRYVAIAAPGVLCSLVGSALLLKARLKRTRQRLHQRVQDSPAVINYTPRADNEIRLPGKDPK